MVGFVMSAFAPNIYVVIAGYGVITGLITIFDCDFQIIERNQTQISRSRDVCFECKISEFTKTCRN